MRYLIPLLLLCGCEAKVQVTSKPPEPVEALIPTVIPPAEPPKKTNLPPGWFMVCDIERGVYSAKWGDGKYVWAYRPDHTNKQDVIDRAWRTHEREQKEQKEPKLPAYEDFNWSTCD